VPSLLHNQVKGKAIGDRGEDFEIFLVIVSKTGRWTDGYKTAD